MRDVMPTLRAIVGSNSELSCRLSEGLPPVPCDLIAIERVLVNPCTNARDAPPGGTIVVSSRLEGLENANDEHEGAAKVVLELQDDGTRIIVSCARGAVWLDSKTGRGITVPIAWPPAR